MRLQARAQSRVDSGLLLLLKNFMIWVAVAVAVLTAWHCRLLPEVSRADSAGLALGVTLVFAAAAVRGSWHVLRLSRALDQMKDLEQYLRRHGFVAFRRGTELPGPHPNFPEGCIAEHVRHLQQKVEFGGEHRRLDQAPLLDALEADLRRGQEFGRFVADLLLSLGLLGTAIGFVLMLGLISERGTTDESAMQSALAAISGGMAVALYTTLAGLVGGMLLKLQCFLLDGAVQELVGRTTRLTEEFVLPAIGGNRHPPATGRMRGDAAA